MILLFGTLLDLAGMPGDLPIRVLPGEFRAPVAVFVTLLSAGAAGAISWVNLRWMLASCERV